jgi:hypothetical protein
MHQNLPQAPLFCGLVHQNLQHDWWKEGPKNEQLAVAEEAQLEEEEEEEEEDDEDDYERVVQNSNSFWLFVVFHGELQNKTLLLVHSRRPPVCVCFGGICSQNGGDFSQKFGYKLNMKIEFKRKTFFYNFWLPVCTMNRNIWRICKLNFGQIMAIEIS